MSDTPAVKLTKAQRMALTNGRLSDAWQSAYGLRERIPTLDGLRARGLVEKRSRGGSLFDPRTGIDWRLTPAGNAASVALLDALKEEGEGR